MKTNDNDFTDLLPKAISDELLIHLKTWVKEGKGFKYRFRLTENESDLLIKNVKEKHND